MSFAVNWQLQIKLKFYVENIALKYDPYDVLDDICCSGMCQVLTRFSAYLATYFILSQQVSQNCNVLIKEPNLTFVYLSFQLSIQNVLFSFLTKRLVVMSDILRELCCKLSS